MFIASRDASGFAFVSIYVCIEDFDTKSMQVFDDMQCFYAFNVRLRILADYSVELFEDCLLQFVRLESFIEVSGY